MCSMCHVVALTHQSHVASNQQPKPPLLDGGCEGEMAPISPNLTNNLADWSDLSSHVGSDGARGHLCTLSACL